MTQTLPNPTSAAPVQAHAPGWGTAAALVVLVNAAIIAAFYETAWSMVAIWLRSGTYAHGFLILPISLWLVWEKRQAVARLAPRGALLPVVLTLPVGLTWLLSHLVDVLVAQQAALVMLLILATWSVIGTRAARLMSFPLGFLLLAVPFGDGLTNPLINFTADFTVGLLRFTGIPVFRDGNYFEIPTGSWSVVEACSGVRYLIASVTLGAVYAYLSYTRLWKRLLFLALAIGVPIIANGLRAYLIVMIGHWSDMKLAVGVDHLIYGWVFFGVVILGMFYLGSLFRDDEPAPPALPAATGGERGSSLLSAAAVVAFAGVWAVAGAVMDMDAGPRRPVELVLPDAVGAWRGGVPPWDWRPSQVDPDGAVYRAYAREGDWPVSLHLAGYRWQRQGAEVLSPYNPLVSQDLYGWEERQRAGHTAQLRGRPLRVIEGVVASSRGQRLLVWTWARIGDHHTASPYIGKVREVVSRLLAGRRDAGMISVATPLGERPEAAAARLQAFLDAIAPVIDGQLDRMRGP